MSMVIALYKDLNIIVNTPLTTRFKTTSFVYPCSRSLSEKIYELYIDVIGPFVMEKKAT